VHIFCVDVGAPKNIGWADSLGQLGTGEDIGLALKDLGGRLALGERVAIGFEAPIWTPRRADLLRITGSRLGAETAMRRPWSAGAGCGVLGAALALMPWCFSTIVETSGRIRATTLPDTFTAWTSGLFVWEALVTGAAKGLSHHADAALAVTAFAKRQQSLYSDIPTEPAINHAAVALSVAGLDVEPTEFGRAGLVVAVGYASPFPADKNPATPEWGSARAAPT
jgi:hypothetical protein